MRTTRSVTALFIVFFLLAAPLIAQAQKSPTPPSGVKKINLNSATVQELVTLPKIGEKTAQRILDNRTKNGRFQKIEDLMKVKGIGEKTFLKLKDKIFVG